MNVVAFWILNPIAAIIVISMFISIQNFNTNCGGSLISLPMWLIINSCLIILSLIEAMINFSYDSTIRNEMINCRVRVIFSITLILDLVFKIIWTIIGYVALFRDSMDCYTNVYSLWTMTLLAIIVSSMIIVIMSVIISYIIIFYLSIDHNPIPNQAIQLC